MRTIEKNINIDLCEYSESGTLKGGESIEEVIRKGIFFDLEHAILHEPKCIGIFGAGIYEEGVFKTTQYFLESSLDKRKITIQGVEYFKKQSSNGKEYIITFAGSNDFKVLNYFINKYRLSYIPTKHFKHIDIQKEFQRERQDNFVIGLKALESVLGIKRDVKESPGREIAKTFLKLIKSNNEIKKIKADTIETFLIYNENDVVNLLNILLNWKRINNEEVTAYLLDMKRKAKELRENAKEEARIKREILEKQENTSMKIGDYLKVSLIKKEK